MMNEIDAQKEIAFYHTLITSLGNYSKQQARKVIEEKFYYFV